MLRYQRLRNFKHILEALREQLLYDFPAHKLICVGVTGTDGKTTTSSLISHILTTAGLKTTLSGTLSSPHMTTFGRGWVHKFLWQSLKSGTTHAVIEVTSIAIHQNRVWGVPFTLGVLTNIANNEHLDYHGSFSHYRDTKISFLLGCKTIVANADDPSIAVIRSKIRTQKLLTYALNSPADVTPQNFKYHTSLLGQFNAYNILAAAAACRVLGVAEPFIKQGIKTFQAPPGRLEIVTTKPFTVIVDFAHTPQAFSQVLPVAKKLSKKRLLHVFGATGNRDRGKRPIMAKIASRYDDFIFLTHEDTYTEDPQRIFSELEAGLKQAKYKSYQIVASRKEAIRRAFDYARPGDVVIITGVGHQKSMNIGGKEIPWSDQATALALLGRH